MTRTPSGSPPGRNTRTEKGRATESVTGHPHVGGRRKDHPCGPSVWVIWLGHPMIRVPPLPDPTGPPDSARYPTRQLAGSPEGRLTCRPLTTWCQGEGSGIGAAPLRHLGDWISASRLELSTDIESGACSIVKHGKCANFGGIASSADPSTHGRPRIS